MLKNRNQPKYEALISLINADKAKLKKIRQILHDDVAAVEEEGKLLI